MTTGEKIKSIRISSKMTQNSLAEKCGMADSAIRKYESGKITPKFETIKKIATALGVSPLDLMGDVELAVTAGFDTLEKKWLYRV